MDSALFPSKVSPVGSAVFSGDNLYRYQLTRTWDVGPMICWVLLNPSTATGEVDDPTITRCFRYSQEWGFGGLYILNL